MIKFLPNLVSKRNTRHRLLRYICDSDAWLEGFIVYSSQIVTDPSIVDGDNAVVKLTAGNPADEVDHCPEYNARNAATDIPSFSAQMLVV